MVPLKPEPVVKEGSTVPFSCILIILEQGV
jgi:hypothetical protein